MNAEKDDSEMKDEKTSLSSKHNIKEKKERSGEDYFKGGMLLLVGIIVSIAAFQLYFIVNEVIYTWFKPQYVPLVMASYNLGVIVVGLWVLKGYILKKEK
ncbi:hypothetical protein [Methanolobus sp. WCC5]|jgi:hypothetical protein|uniref:hypothetical protein n=1 Tax=Methanolobus sp. WCC5 TaxID=3125785 RepID=UPI0032543F80